MPTIRLPGVKDIVTGEFLLNPTFEAGDVMISLDAGPFVDTTNLPTILVPGESPIMDLELTTVEYDASGVLRFEDLDEEWETFYVYNYEGYFDTKEVYDQLVDIMNKLTLVSQVPLPLNTTSQLTLIRGDAYDDVSRDKIVWDVDRDIDGKPYVATFKDEYEGLVLLSTSGVGVGTEIQLELTSAQTELLPITTALGLGTRLPVFDIEIEMDTNSYWTPVIGTFRVIPDTTEPDDR